MKRRTLSISGLAVALALVAVLYGVFDRKRTLTRLTQTASAQATLPVQIILPTPGPKTRLIVLPGTVRAWHEASIFAQVSGYVVSWNVDYGTSVRAGQLLATIDTPSLDAQYAAVKASFGVAVANYRLAESTAQRWVALSGTPAVSQQEVDVQVAAAVAREAELEAAAQEVARYEALEGFKRVVAPFDGVVTARLTDVGSYVNAAGGDVSVRGSSTELFTVADVHEMRVFVSVPQDYASQLAAGLIATIHLPSNPGKHIDAKFLTTARAFSPTTRTAVTELTVDNAAGSLWPGTYVEVQLQVPSDPSVLTMPEEAMIFRAGGAQVAIVDGNNRVHLHDVTLGHILGQTVQVTSGVTAGDKLVNNPPADLLEGQSITPVEATPGYDPTTSNRHSPPEAPPPPGTTAAQSSKTRR